VTAADEEEEEGSWCKVPVDDNDDKDSWEHVRWFNYNLDGTFWSFDFYTYTIALFLHSYYSRSMFHKTCSFAV
jgi:hypothetical protein